MEFIAEPRLLFATLAIAGATYVALRLLSRSDRRIEGRIDETARRPMRADAAGRSAQAQLPARFRLAKAILSKLGRRLLPDDSSQRQGLQQRLIEAGIYSPSALPCLAVVRLLLIAAPVLLSLSAAATRLVGGSSALLGGTLGASAGVLIPNAWLAQRKRKRQRIFWKSLPDLLDLMVACLEGGLSFEAALQRVTEELRLAHPLLAGELSLVQREMHLGQLPHAALRHFADRCGMETIRTLSTLIDQSRRLGTGMGEALRVHADMLRSQREQRAEELAQKASVKILFPTLLFIFPAILLVLAGPAAIQLAEKLVGPGPSAPLH